MLRNKSKLLLTTILILALMTPLVSFAEEISVLIPFKAEPDCTVQIEALNGAPKANQRQPQNAGDGLSTSRRFCCPEIRVAMQSVFSSKFLLKCPQKGVDKFPKRRIINMLSETTEHH